MTPFCSGLLYGKKEIVSPFATLTRRRLQNSPINDGLASDWRFLEVKRQTYFREVGSDYSPVCELPTGQCLQSLARRIRSVIFDINLADTIGLPTPTTRPWNLHLKHFTVLIALFLDVFTDF